MRGNPYVPTMRQLARHRSITRSSRGPRTPGYRMLEDGGMVVGLAHGIDERTTALMYVDRRSGKVTRSATLQPFDDHWSAASQKGGRVDFEGIGDREAAVRWVETGQPDLLTRAEAWET